MDSRRDQVDFSILNLSWETNLILMCIKKCFQFQDHEMGEGTAGIATTKSEAS